MNISSLRVPSILILASVACVLITGVASAAEPKTGKYAGEEGNFELDFKVKDPASKPATVQGFEFSGPICSTPPDESTIEVPKAMKVKSSGNFAYEGEGEFDGEPTDFDFIVDAKFSASKTAKGTLFVTACPLAGQFEFVIKKGGGDSLEAVSSVRQTP